MLLKDAARRGAVSGALAGVKPITDSIGGSYLAARNTAFRTRVVDIHDGGVGLAVGRQDAPPHQPPAQRLEHRRQRLHHLLRDDACRSTC